MVLSTARKYTTLLCVVLFAVCKGETNPLDFSTKECFLTDPVYDYKFDFTSLTSDLAHLAKGIKDDVFEYNICGHLSKSCNGKTGVAACLKKDNKEYVLGTEHELHYHNGKMYFSFLNGTTCANGTGQFQLHVIVGCDYTLDKIQSQVTAYADDACSFYIKLETPKACLPEPEAVKSNTCSVKDPKTGHIYDLLPLSDDNYRASDHNGSAFVINVCKPVLYAENAMCPAGSSVCFVDLKASDYKKKFFDYGSVEANPTIEDGQLLMRLSSQTPCNRTVNYTSTIYFRCDKNVKNAHPELISAQSCSYEFSLFTPLACNDLPSCTVITHGTEMLDMRGLKDKPFTVKMQDKSYTFGVCSNAGSPCLENAGACVTDSNGQSNSLGIANSNLRFNQTGSPFLLYEGGANCPKSDDASKASTTQWSTKIEFVCANNSSEGQHGATIAEGPKIIENTNCQLLIHYYTSFACQEQIKCKTKVYVDHSENGGGEETVDLTPLISTTANYEALVDPNLITQQKVDKATKFFLNVCRPLVPKYGLGCPGGSAACMAKVGNSPTPEKEQSLGFPLASLVATNRTNAELRYLQGSPCPTDKLSQLSTAIEFNCNMAAGLGTPVLEAILDCHYQFKWATNVICPPHMCDFKADTCEIINSDVNVSFNLKKASFTDEGKLKLKKDNNQQLTVDLCGEKIKVVTDYSQGLVNLFFNTKCAFCMSGLNVQLRVICNAESSMENSFVEDKKSTNFYVIQYTPDICKFIGLDVPIISDKTTTAPLPSTTSIPLTTTTASSNTNDKQSLDRKSTVGAILAAILSLTFVMTCCGMIAFSPERRNSIRRLFRRSAAAVRYSRVSNEEANLLLEPNGEFTDSDDDMLL